MPRFVAGKIEVSVPATSANLGPGFDSLGLALNLRDRVTVEVTAHDLEISVAGAGAQEVPRDESHLVYQAMCRTFAETGCAVPGIRLHCDNVIPHGRGLGSSSAAIVAGICAARGLTGQTEAPMDDHAVLELAADIEGHPDNVAPALFGGFTIASYDQQRVRATTVPVDPSVLAVVFVPPGAVATRAARALLPTSVPHAAAAANAGRAALLVAALSCHPSLLLSATEDRIHQDYREPLMPATLGLVRELRQSSVAAVVSGAGPSVLAFADATTAVSMQARTPQGWRGLVLEVDRDGAVVTRAS